MNLITILRSLREQPRPLTVEEDLYLNWSPKNGRHEVCKFDFLEGL